MGDPIFIWDSYDADTFTQQITAAYTAVIHWCFMVPFGNVGKSFVSELAKLYRAYAELGLRHGGHCPEVIHCHVCPPATKTTPQIQSPRSH